MEVAFTVSIKSFRLQEIQKRNKEGKRGKRMSHEGAIYDLIVKDGEITYIEPRIIGMDLRGVYDDGLNLYGANDQVYKFDPVGEKVYIHSDPWFSFIHTLDFFNEKMLVCSSGYDCLIEIDEAGEKRRWFAHENGWELKETMYAGVPFPKDKRPAFISGAHYWAGGILITTFYEGCVWNIDFDGKKELLMDDLLYPHSAKPTPKGYMVCDTGRGRLVGDIFESDIGYAEMNTDWLQCWGMSEGWIILVDSTNHKFIFMNGEEKHECIFPSNWAVQDIG